MEFESWIRSWSSKILGTSPSISPHFYLTVTVYPPKQHNTLNPNFLKVTAEYFTLTISITKEVIRGLKEVRLVHDNDT